MFLTSLHLLCYDRVATFLISGAKITGICHTGWLYRVDVDSVEGIGGLDELFSRLRDIKP